MSETVFGKNLRFYRKKLGMTQAELGREYGIGQVSIANYEKGLRFPGEKTILLLAKALGVSIGLLFSESADLSDTRMKDYKGRSQSFSVEELMEYLLKKTPDDCMNYVLGWMNSAGLSLRDCFTRVITPALYETGVRWQGGEMTVVEEHLISERLRELITLIAAHDRRSIRDRSRTGPVWLGLCAPSDKHDLGLFMLSQLLRSRGWRTFFLGPDVPVKDLTGFMERYKPDLINISIISDLFRGGLEAYLMNLDRQERTDCPIVITGEGFSSEMEGRYKNILYFTDILDRGYKYAIGLENRERGK